MQGRAWGQRLLPAPRLPRQWAGESSSPHYSGSSALTFHASAAAKLSASLCIELSQGITQPSWLKAQPRGRELPSPSPSPAMSHPAKHGTAQSCCHPAAFKGGKSSARMDRLQTARLRLRWVMGTPVPLSAVAQTGQQL